MLKTTALALALSLAMTLAAASAARAGEDPGGARWWAHIERLAADDTQGRLPGSPGYEKAAEYVIGQFRDLGLKPAGVDGYRQPVRFGVQTILAAESHATLDGPSGARPLAVGEDVLFGARFPERKTFDAPLVFVGYGLHLPEAGYDEFAGVDLKGKTAVFIGGGPSDLPGNLKAHARNDTIWQILEAAGAVGAITIPLPSAMDFPWSRQIKLSSQPGMYLSDASLRPLKWPMLQATVNPAHADMLFAGSGHTLAEVIAAADASQRMHAFPLKTRLSGAVATEVSQIVSPNLIARLDGSDPTLKSQVVVVSAHLDHLGVGEPINGETIYRGAMDDASGVASVLEVARDIVHAPTPPKRSVMFVIVTAEEKGLLGSRYFAHHPTAPAGSIVADLNFDMPLPLFPLHDLVLYGLSESTLADNARRIAQPLGYKVIADPYPNRNAFVRTDLYSFVQVGVPAVAFRFGAESGTPEEHAIKAWLAERYHSPTDDLAQPVDKAAAANLDDYVAQMTVDVADQPDPPAWRPDSFFRRFANGS
jgi:hypothetical protein